MHRSPYRHRQTPVAVRLKHPEVLNLRRLKKRFAEFFSPLVWAEASVSRLYERARAPLHMVHARTRWDLRLPSQTHPLELLECLLVDLPLAHAPAVSPGAQAETSPSSTHERAALEPAPQRQIHPEPESSSLVGATAARTWRYLRRWFLNDSLSEWREADGFGRPQ